MTSIQKEKIACSYFFAAPTLAYGLFTSRLPAIKELAGIDNASLGGLLLYLGVSTLIGLLISSKVIDIFGARKVTALSAVVIWAGVIWLCMAFNFRQIAVCCVLTGLGVGLCDVGANTLGIEMELRHNKLHLSFLHGVSSAGGVAGALSGAFFAKLEVSPFFNSLLVLGVFAIFWQLAYGNIPPDSKPGENASHLSWRAAPLGLIILGLLSLVAHIAEGSVAEWGSVFLRSIKNAPQDEAALAFAFFTGGMVVCRLIGDRIRCIIGDAPICFYGSLAGAAGMTLAIMASLPWLSLAGFLIMGLGLALIVPIFFSRAGKIPGISPRDASAVISTFSYSGLLLFPPLIGYLAQVAGLVHALWTVVGCCVLLVAGSFVIKARAS